MPPLRCLLERTARQPGGRALALLPLLLLAGCGGGSSGSSAPLLQVIDAAYRAPAQYDVQVGGSSVDSQIGFGQATAQLAVSAGTQSVAFDPTGTTTAAYTATATPAAGQVVAVVAVEDGGTLSAISVVQASVAPGTNQAQLAFANADPAQAAIDLFVTAPAATLPIDPVVSNLGYPGDGASTTPAQVGLAAGDARIRAVAHGDTTATVLFDSGPVTLAAGADVLALVVPADGSASPFALLMVSADGSTYTVGDQRVPVRFGNFALPAASIDAFVDGAGTADSVATRFAAGIGAGTATAYQDELPGSVRVSVAPAGSFVESIGTPLALAQGAPLSLFTAGAGAAGTSTGLQLLVLHDDLAAPAAGMSALRLVALAPDLGAVDVVALDATGVIVQSLGVNLAYTAATAYLAVPPGTYTLATVPTGSNSPRAPASGTPVTLGAGTVYTLVINGCRSPGSGICASAATPITLTVLQDR